MSNGRKTILTQIYISFCIRENKKPKYFVPVSGIRRPASGDRHAASGVRHAASGVRCQAPVTGCRWPLAA